MKRRTKKLTTIVIALVILIFGINQYLDLGLRTLKYYSTKSSDLTNEQISGISLNQSMRSKDFIDRFGEGKDLNNALFDYYKLNNGITIATEKNDDKIIRIGTHSSEFETKNGLKVGSYKNTIIEQYGEDYFERFEQGSNIIGYIDKKSKATIEFWIVDNKVFFIRLDKSKMY
ncbi:hypothetical protein GC096_32875 [Paenibacillus sp. LMG 31461]|uniref:Uncharacterized protein n=1 Tax=Paenibacillus plantarum TaxID=2654975 RepID=A0ABX1XJU7_9BACL|nr:hypothetical protein [Paenibacillus plantarum]NOU68818.1 hypothetical protein [Paenibacillus plantarum]